MLRQVTLPKVSARVLELHMGKLPLQQTQQGLYQPEYEGRDRQKWSKIARKLLDPLGDYDEKAQGILEELRLSGPTNIEETRQLQQELDALDKSEGEELISIIFESDEFSFLEEHWWKLQLPSDRRSRKVLDPIDEALEPWNENSNPNGWREVKLEDGKVVFVNANESAVPKPSKNMRSNLRQVGRR